MYQEELPLSGIVFQAFQVLDYQQYLQIYHHNPSLHMRCIHLYSNTATRRALLEIVFQDKDYYF